eukprot:92099-Rhodomonas_salina.3
MQSSYGLSRMSYLLRSVGRGPVLFLPCNCTTARFWYAVSEQISSKQASKTVLGISGIRGNGNDDTERSLGFVPPGVVHREVLLSSYEKKIPLRLQTFATTEKEKFRRGNKHRRFEAARESILRSTVGRMARSTCSAVGMRSADWSQ